MIKVLHILLAYDRKPIGSLLKSWKPARQIIKWLPPKKWTRSLSIEPLSFDCNVLHFYLDIKSLIAVEQKLPNCRPIPCAHLTWHNFYINKKYGRFSGHSDFPHSTPSPCVISRFSTCTCESIRPRRWKRGKKVKKVYCGQNFKTINYKSINFFSGPNSLWHLDGNHKLIR